MPDILHRVGIDATPQKVYETLTTLEGNRQWLDARAGGSATQGETLRFFGDRVDMKVVETKANEVVTWKCVKGPEEWVDTEVEFRLVNKDGQTFVLFTHAKWKSAVEFMHHCSTKWAIFMLSLKELVETGKGQPTPSDVQVYVGEHG